MNQEYFDLLANSKSDFQHLVPLPNADGGVNPEAVTGVAGSSDALVSSSSPVDLIYSHSCEL